MAYCTHCGKRKEIDHETIDPRYPMVRCLNATKDIVVRPGVRASEEVALGLIRSRRERSRRRAHERHSLRPKDERPKSCKLCAEAR